MKKINNSQSIEYKYLSELDINDPFFDSLKNDYIEFEKWFLKKQEENKQAYVTIEDNKIKSFMMLKVEDKDEDYSNFLKPFIPAKRLKISTIKVADKGKKIGDSFIEIILKKAKQESTNEIYITVFDKQKHLIKKLESYGFQNKTKKKTNRINESFELENVFVKDMKNNYI